MKKERVISAEGRARISKAQKARWAKLHKEKAVLKKEALEDKERASYIKQVPVLCTRDKLIVSLAQTGMSSTVIAAILQTYDEAI